MASADLFSIVVTGKQTHAAQPHSGIDPIVAAAQIVMGLQTIVSRQINATTAPTVISVAQINGGERWNIIPEKVEMTGTIRCLEKETRCRVHERLKKTAQSIAEAAGAEADVTFREFGPVCCNDLTLHKMMLPTLKRVTGESHVFEAPATMGSEDFAHYQEHIPGYFFYIGATPPQEESIQLHTPLFNTDDRALILGVRAMANLAVDYLSLNGEDGRRPNARPPGP